MHSGGQLMRTIDRTYSFESSSDRNRFYQTIVWSDGLISCDCPGWTRRVQPDGSRTCKHTRSVRAGTAHLEAFRVVPGSGAAYTAPVGAVSTLPKRDSKRGMQKSAKSRVFDFSEDEK
jgi:hypothetical protein